MNMSECIRLHVRVFLVRLRGLIVCVTHQHFIYSLSFKIFRGNMSETIRKILLRWSAWQQLFEVVLVKLLPCHSQHFQHYRAWMSLLFPVVSFKLLSMYGSTIILVSLQVSSMLGNWLSLWCLWTNHSLPVYCSPFLNTVLNDNWLNAWHKGNNFFNCVNSPYAYLFAQISYYCAK